MRVVNPKNIRIRKWSKWVSGVLTILGLLVGTSLSAQDSAIIRMSAPVNSSKLSVIIPSSQLLTPPFYSQNNIAAQTTPPPDLRILSTTPKAYCYDRLGIFCKLDVQLDNSLKMPVRFRLGNLETVNRKEGKWERWSE